MASRSSSGGMGVLVALVVFILLSVALLLTTMLFYTKQQKSLRAQQAAEADLAEYVTPAEKGRDDIKQIAEIAKADRNANSVVGYLKSQLDQVMTRAAGSPRLTTTDLENQLATVGLEQGDHMLGSIQSLRQEVDNLKDQAAMLQGQLDEANRLVEQQTEATNRLRNEYDQARASLNARINEIQNLANQYREQVEAAELSMDERVGGIRGQYEQQIGDLNARLEDSLTESAQLKDAVQSLQERLKGVTVGLQDEATLIDGEVVRSLDNNEVFINLGSQDHIVLGMTFEVYGAPTDVRPDSLGAMPRGKATVEVVRVGQAVSTARVIRSTAGQAVVEGDVLVNAIYDRDKEYSFYVFGEFDLDGENGPTELETEMVKSRIQEWGGSIRDTFAGDIDFLVLGVEPQRPLPLGNNATPAQIRRWVAQQRFYDDYQEYLERARDLSIPVLNQNRLLTLIGYFRR